MAHVGLALEREVFRRGELGVRLSHHEKTLPWWKVVAPPTMWRQPGDTSMQGDDLVGELQLDLAAVAQQLIAPPLVEVLG